MNNNEGLAGDLGSPGSSSGFGYIAFNVVGVTFLNDDGSSRQSIISNCKRDDEIRLVREPENKFDKNAIAIFHKLGQVGYVAKDFAKQMAPDMDYGYSYEGVIANVTGGNDDYVYGLDVVVKITGMDAV